MNVVHYSVERSPAYTIVSFLKSIYADEHSIGGCPDGDRSVGIYDNREKTYSTRVLNDVFDAMLPVMPEKRLTTLQIKTSPTFPTERVNHFSGFFKSQVFITTSGYLAV